jgi:hypothetical protein
MERGRLDPPFEASPTGADEGKGGSPQGGSCGGSALTTLAQGHPYELKHRKP